MTSCHFSRWRQYFCVMKSVSQGAVADAQSAEAEAAQLAREAKHRLQEAADRECQHAQVLHYPFQLQCLAAGLPHAGGTLAYACGSTIEHQHSDLCQHPRRSMTVT